MEDEAALIEQVAVLMANATIGSDTSNGSRSNYAGAAADQLSYLLTVAPKSADGAISHRAEQVQLWFALHSPRL